MDFPFSLERYDNDFSKRERGIEKSRWIRISIRCKVKRIFLTTT